MPLFFADGRPFVTGWQSHVFYAPTSAEPKARLVLRVALEGLTTQAMVDTGGLYLFCMPSVAQALHLDAAQALGAQTILFRDERVRGTLHRLTLTLLAEEGEDLQLDVTAFVPDAGYENVPELPRFSACTAAWNACGLRLIRLRIPSTLVPPPQQGKPLRCTSGFPAPAAAMRTMSTSPSQRRDIVPSFMDGSWTVCREKSGFFQREPKVVNSAKVMKT